MTDSFVDPNSGAAPQPGGYAGPEGVLNGHGTPALTQFEAEASEEEVEALEETDDDTPSDDTEADGGDADGDADADADGGDGDDDAKGDDGEEAVAYDPSEHSVKDVQAYLAENPDQHDAVIAAEQAGKNRSTLTGE